MNGNDSTRFYRERPTEPIAEPPADVEDLSAEERAALAERLDLLADVIQSDLRDLAAVVKAGDTPSESHVETARSDLSLAEETVRRHLGGVGEADVEADPRERDLSAWGALDAAALVEADADDVAARFSEDVGELRTAAGRVDRGLYVEDLSDADVSELWDAAGRVEAWARDVLTHRTDREVLLSREEAEAADGLDRGDDASSPEVDHA